MVSSTDSIIVSLKNSIVTKINTLIGNHNIDSSSHSDIRTLINTKANETGNVNTTNLVNELDNIVQDLIELGEQ